MAHLRRTPTNRELRQRFPDLEQVSTAMVRRTFDITAKTAARVLRSARKQAAREVMPDQIRELMTRFRFSESEARWAYENVGMPE